VKPITRQDPQVFASVKRILRSLGEQGFFGTLELKFEAGHIVLLRKTETLRPESERRDNRGTAHEHSTT
jgi:hypothetical protein